MGERFAVPLLLVRAEVDRYWTLAHVTLINEKCQDAAGVAKVGLQRCRVHYHMTLHVLRLVSALSVFFFYYISSMGSQTNDRSSAYPETGLKSIWLHGSPRYLNLQLSLLFPRPHVVTSEQKSNIVLPAVIRYTKPTTAF